MKRRSPRESAYSRNKLMPRRFLRLESLEPRMLLSVDWRNPVDHLDVNQDSRISAIDALLVINELNRSGPGQLPSQKDPTLDYINTNGDSRLSAIDALMVINHLNSPNRHRELRGLKSFDNQQEIQITLGQPMTDGTRVYQMQIETTAFSSLQDTLLDDLLSIYLVSPNDPTKTLLDRGVNGTSLFSLSARGAELATGLVRWDGSVLEIDVGSIQNVSTGILRAQLLSRSPNSQAFVNLRPLSNTIVDDIQPGQLVQLNEEPLPSGGSINMDQFILSESIQSRMRNVRYERSSGMFSAEVDVQNLDSAVGRDVVLVFPGIPSSIQVRNASGIDMQGRPYLNLRESIRSGGLGRNERSERVELVIANPDRIPLDLRPEVWLGQPNRAPVIPTIDNQTVVPGDRVEINIGATDADGDQLTYSVRSATNGLISLPSGRIESGSGKVVFEPTPDQLGQYQVEVLASDGALTVFRTFTLNVVEDQIGTTRVSGRVLDVDSSPIPGMVVEIGAVQALTQLDGRFLLDLGSGPIATDTLRIRGETYADPQNPETVYPFIAEKLPFMLGRQVYTGFNNVLHRPIYLPKLNSGTPVDPTVNTIVSATLRPSQAPVEVVIAAGTLLTQQGAPYTGNLSITEVPIDRTPAALPRNLLPDFLVTIQPGEMTFITPAPVSFPNTGGWEAGMLMDLWSINPVTGEFEIVGEMAVSPDGASINTTTGGIRNSSWHFPAPPPPTPNSDDEGNEDTDCNECKATGPGPSNVELHSGAYLEHHALVTYQSLGQTRGFVLNYDSLRADPRPIVHLGYSNVVASDNRRLMATIDVYRDNFFYATPGNAGLDFGLRGGEHFWALDRSGSVRAALQIDLRAAPTGVYKYDLTTGIVQFNGIVVTGSTTTQAKEIRHVNYIDSPFGAGWGLAGLQQIIENLDGSLLLIDGDGSELYYGIPTTSNDAYISPPGDFSTLVKEADGSFHRSFPNRTIVRFNSNGRIISEEDRNNNVTRFEYDLNGIIQRIIDPVGLVTNFDTINGYITSITDPAGRITTLKYDLQGNLTRITDPDGTSRNWEYDLAHHITGEIDKRGFREETHYNFAGRVVRGVLADGTEMVYQPVQNRYAKRPDATIDPLRSPSIDELTPIKATYVESNGNVIEAILDKQGQVIELHDQNGRLFTYMRNDNNLVASSTDSRGFTTNYQYDTKGNVVSLIDSVVENTATEGQLFPQLRYGLAERPYRLASGDFNSDGIRDFVTSNYETASISVLLGRHDGTPGQPVRYRISGSNSQSVAVGDINSDGILDLVTANFGTSNASILVGNGDGTFAPATTLAVNGTGTNFASLADINGDGRLDLLTANSFSNTVSVLLGNGNGTFATPRVFPVGDQPMQLVASDLNGDGIMDLAIANSQSNDISILFGKGDGNFEVGGTLLSGAGPHTLISVDVSNDGMIDLVSANASDNTLSVFLGMGNGTFGAAMSYPTGQAPHSMQSADFNGDGNIDLAITNFSSDDVSILLGGGDGTFGELVNYRVGLNPTGLVVHDIDRDGLADLIVANRSSKDLSVVYGKSGGAFQVARDFATGVNANSVATGDFNGDGVADMAVSNVSPSTVSILIGTGDGDFLAPQDYTTTGSVPRWITIGDFNTDGQLDLATANEGNHSVSVFLGNGNGTFAPAIQSPGGNAPKYITAADFNDDGIVDLATVSAFLGKVNILLGQGDGSFVHQSSIDAGVLPSSVAIADLNKDGVMDLVTEHIGLDDGVAIMLGMGEGVFQPPQQIILGRDFDPDHVIAVDINYDGNVDIISANRTNVSILPGNGDGTFGLPTILDVGNNDSKHIAVGDLNGDNLIDIVATDTVGTLRVLLSLGSGQFSAPIAISVGRAPSFSSIADFNLDGLPDIVTANNGSGDVSVVLGQAASVVRAPRFTYENQFNQLIRSADELGRITLYEVEPIKGNRVAKVQVDGAIDSVFNGQTNDLITSYSYTEFGLIDTLTDPLGRVSDLDYDNFGRLITITTAKGTPDEAVFRYEYDAAGNRTATVDGNGNRTEFEFDSLNRLIRIIEADPDGSGFLTSPITVLDYDEQGNLTSTIDARGNRTNNFYDARNRLIRSVGPDPDGNSQLLSPVTNYGYDLFGNLTKIVDPNGNITRFNYDSRNRRIESIDPDGGITRFTYDSDHNLTRLIDPVGNTTQYIYDARSRPIQEIDPLGEVIVYSYDAANNLVRKSDRNGRETRFTYDDLHRLIREDWMGSTGSAVNTIEYSFDKSGNLLGVHDKFSALIYTYDARNRVKSVDNRGGQVPVGTPNVPRVILNYSYDGNGNVISVADTIEGVAGATNTYFFDGLNRKTQLNRSGIDVSNKRVDFIYNPLGQYSTIDRYSDLAAAQYVIGSDFTYDSQNRLTRIDHANPDGQSLLFFGYEYDPASRITKITDQNQSTDYGYDKRDQLVSARYGDAARTDEAFKFDANGNRVESNAHGTAYRTGPGNRLLTDGVYNYEYDYEGNLTKRTEIATGSTWEFQWDHRNRLTILSDKNASGVLQQVIRYTYDPLGRRISKQVDTTPLDTVDAAIEQYVYDGEDVILDFVDPDGSGPADSQQSTRYLRGPGIDNLLAIESASGTNWVLQDHLGSTRALVSSAGVLVQSIDYDSFGKAIVAGSPSTRYLYTGRELDTESGLFYYRARYYDPSTGRFTNEDPIGFAGGSWNTQIYVDNSPISWIDPMGLEKWYDKLPNCPCSTSDPRNLDKWYRLEPADQKYHPGADECMRSKPTEDGGPGQQCCYSGGELLVAGPGAGTPDKVAPDGPIDALNHYKQDVKPWEKMGWEKYNELWKPNRGQGCTCKAK